MRSGRFRLWVRHCERSEAIQNYCRGCGPDCFGAKAPRNDGACRRYRMLREQCPWSARSPPAITVSFPGVFQYSSGAAADPGYEIERVRFDAVLPLAEGFAAAADYIRAAGRPL